MAENFSATAAFIWSVADLLRGDFKQSQYGRIILPFTLLRRLEMGGWRPPRPQCWLNMKSARIQTCRSMPS